MKSWLLAALIAAGGSGGYLFWQNYYTPQPSSLGQYVPADTVLYLGGSTNPAILAQIEHVYSSPDMADNIELLAQRLDQGSERGGSYPSLNRFAASLLRDLFAPGSNLQSIYKRLGLNISGSQQVFVDGLVPVMHLSAADNSDTFTNFWAQHGRSAGLAVYSDSLDGQGYTRIQLSPPESVNRLDLIIAQRQGMAIISFATPLDTEGELAQRLRMTEPNDSLVSSGKIAQLIQAYGFTDDFSFLFDIEGVTRAIMQLDQSRMGQDVESLFALLQEPPPTQTLTQVCRQEYARIASWMPRVVAGYTAIQTAPTLQLDSRSILEIKAGDVLNQLQLLNGHVPVHVKDPKTQLLGIGLGLDMDQLMPVVVQLWNQFNQQTFACEALRQAQARASQNNPALMGLVTGMLQGVKGVGLSLYDFQYGGPTKPVGAIDMLLSIATENPALLTSLAAGLPFADLGSIPIDGSQVQINLSQLQPGLFAEVGVNGKHLTFASGNRAISAASLLKTENIDANALMQLSINYPAFSGLVEKIPLDQIQPLVTDSDTSLCLERAKLTEILRQQPIIAGYGLAFSEAGLDSSVSIAMDKPVAAAEFDVIGRFKLFDQTWDCSNGYLIGYEELRADGTGSFREQDSLGRCDTYAYDYKWTRESNQIKFEIANPRGRESCESQWSTYDGYTASCQLISSDSGFACIYEDDESEGLFVYRPADDMSK